MRETVVTNDRECGKAVRELLRQIAQAKDAFRVPDGESTLSGDTDYMEDVGRMTLEMFNRTLRTKI